MWPELFRCGGYKMITGIPTLISTATPSNTSEVAIISGIDSTYNSYLFVFTDLYMHQDGDKFTFQSGASYNNSTTTAPINCYNYESGGTRALDFYGSGVASSETGFVELTRGFDNSASSAMGGYMYLYNPANTSFLKVISWNMVNQLNTADGSTQQVGAGNINVTAAVTQIKFKAQANNMTGTIQLYGIT